jgi:mannose-6-phosphate isomerase-like protein (cupin superfamily)
MTATATVLQPGEGEAIWQLGNQFTVKAAGDRTGGRFALLEQVCAGMPPPMHIHEADDEAFYVLAGSVDLHVGDEVHHAEAGAFCFVPAGVTHSFLSTSAEPARLLLVVSPPGFEQFFAEVQRRFPEAEGVPDPAAAGPVLAELAAQYGLQIVGPPPS